MLIAWCWAAAAVLIVSLAAHVSTFLGIDPMTRWPGVMFIHVAIFPPFIAAICYANRIGGPEEKRQEKAMNAAPRWLRILTGFFFVYTFVNFAIFIVLNEGGGPEERDGKYLLMSHGRVIREITEEEYHRQQAYVVRGFSGHWMMFSCAALMLLVGASRLRGVPSEAPAARVDSTEEEECEAKAEPPPEPITVLNGVVSLVVYVACLALIFSGRPVLSVVAVLPVIISVVLAARRRHGFPHRRFETYIGCLAVFPNAIIASLMGKRVAEFIYLALYVGLGAASGHEVAVTFPKEGPSQLSNGELLDNRLWSGLMLFVQFPLLAVGTIGLTCLAEQVGRLVEVRRRKKKPDAVIETGAERRDIA